SGGQPGYAPQSLCPIRMASGGRWRRIEVRTIRSTKSRSDSDSGAPSALAEPGIFTLSYSDTPRRFRNLRMDVSKRAAKQEMTEASAWYTSCGESKWKTFSIGSREDGSKALASFYQMRGAGGEIGEEDLWFRRPDPDFGGATETNGHARTTRAW